MKPTVVVAGPGAGKTHNMVNEIATRIPELSPNRFLVAITYTNAAADMIRTRLHQRVRPTRNVYIGTIHSFLNRFILSPFAVVLEQLPEDHIFVSADVNVPNKTKTGQKRTPQEMNIAKAAKLAALLKRGIVPYDKMSSVAATLVETKEVRRLVGQRLQYLFVDEFQDVDTTQHRVFESLRKEKKTEIYVVGDPEQYISSFTYRVRGIKAPEYGKIPFFRFATQSDRQSLETNHRSCDEVVEFTNQFHGQLRQKGQQGTRGVQRVVFVEEQEVEPIIERFCSLTDEWHSGDAPISRLYLSHFNSTLDAGKQRYGLVPVSNSGASHTSLLQEAMEVIAKSLGMSQRRVCSTFDLEQLAWRKAGLQLLKAIRAGEVGTSDDLNIFLKNRFATAELGNDGDVSHELDVLVDCVLHGTARADHERISSIHKAKGLEADAVLVVAKTQAELRKWCERDSSVRAADKEDICRIGFVAFSRARESLVLACLKEIDDETKTLLVSLGVRII
jgi:DNA helicase-2/ATP-dependent DNA helicase PcrA